MWGKPSGLANGGGPVSLPAGYLGRAGLTPPRPDVFVFHNFASGLPFYNIFGAIEIKAASPCKHARQAKLADGATV